jgi:hypothetical protein
MRLSTAFDVGVDPCDAVAEQFMAVVRVMRRQRERLDALVPIAWHPATCPNCDRAPGEAESLFCGELCRQEASFVRYVRSAIATGRIANRGVLRLGLGTQLIMLANGGYATRARTVAPDVRVAVRKRESGRCRLCGDPGTAIDHIAGDDSRIANLQLLCTECNTNKMAAGVVVITRESHPESFAFIERQRKRLAARSASERVLRICDDEQEWKAQWREHRRRAIDHRRTATARAS